MNPKKMSELPMPPNMKYHKWHPITNRRYPLTLDAASSMWWGGGEEMMISTSKSKEVKWYTKIFTSKYDISQKSGLKPKEVKWYIKIFTSKYDISQKSEF
jgi:hypothetical protein